MESKNKELAFCSGFFQIKLKLISSSHKSTFLETSELIKTEPKIKKRNFILKSGQKSCYQQGK